MTRATAWLAALALAGGAHAQNIIRGEYFIDLDQGFGKNIPFEIADDNEVANLDLTIDLDGYVPGTHTIGIRTYNDSARWSLTNFSKAVITEPPPALDELVEVEYFLNQDPYFDEGLTAWTGNSLEEPITFEPDLSAAVVGVNTLFIRSRTSDGRWSLTNHSPIVVIEPPAELPVVERVEAFNLSVEADPGFGAATPFTIAEPIVDFTGVLGSDVTFAVLQYDTIAIRSRDSNGRWSLTNFIDSVDVIHAGTTDELTEDTGISVFPNPFTDAFTVQPTDAQPLRVILYDPQGKLVHDEVLNTAKRIDLSGLSNGAYTAFFWEELERIHRVTIIKQ